MLDPTVNVLDPSRKSLCRRLVEIRQFPHPDPQPVRLRRTRIAAFPRPFLEAQQAARRPTSNNGSTCRTSIDTDRSNALASRPREAHAHLPATFPMRSPCSFGARPD